MNFVKFGSLSFTNLIERTIYHSKSLHSIFSRSQPPEIRVWGHSTIILSLFIKYNDALMNRNTALINVKLET